MLDVAPTELLLVGIVALLVIGPKDLPKAMRFVGKWVGKARGVARQFRSGFDQMVRESELAELEQQWKAENERIMREHPAEALPAPEAEMHVTPPLEDSPPAMVEQPFLRLEDEPPAATPPVPKRPRRSSTTPPQQDDPLL